MALIKCPECGRQVSNQATTCPNCGFPIRDKLHYTNGYGFCGSPLKCPKCKSQHLHMEIETTAYQTKGREETWKKSLITRTANSAARAGMILATGGLWALTPKKSKYSTVQKSHTKIAQRKHFQCLDCGYNWSI